MTKAQAMISLRTMACAPIVFALLACDQPQQTPQQQNRGVEIAEFKTTVLRLDKSINNLQSETFRLKYRQEQYDNTHFDPAAGKGFGRVETTSGFFLVSLEEVKPYLDGVRVKLNVGNIHSGTYNGFEVVTAYGRRFPVFDPKISEEDTQKLVTAYEASSRTKSETSTQVLRPGTWNTVYLVLPDIKPEDFGHLTLSIKTNQVSLSGGR